MTRRAAVATLPPAQRDTLRRAALAAARGPHDRVSRAALWLRLLDGTWTIVDSFDADGRWLMIAGRNHRDAVARARLSAAEREVVMRAALGHSNKLIGHTLGLAASTVANHLTHAIAKLRLPSRIELIKIYHALNRTN